MAKLVALRADLYVDADAVLFAFPSNTPGDPPATTVRLTNGASFVVPTLVEDLVTVINLAKELG